MLRLLVQVVAVTSLIDAAKILLVPVDHPSHVMFFSLAGDALIDSGHDVALFSHKRHGKVMKKYRTRFLFQETNKPHHTESAEFKKVTDNQFSKDTSVSPATLILGLTKRHAEWCDELAGDTDLMKRLGNEHFDLVIVDGFIMARCYYFIPYKLNVKHMTFSAMPDPWNARVPTFPSVEPYQLLPVTNQMGFIDRLKNFGVFIAMSTAIPYVIGYDEIITKHIPERQAVTLMELYRQSEMFLINLDTFILDYPRTSAPHYQFVRGMGSVPAKPLPADLETFVSGAEDGIVVVSFGSLIKDMPMETLNRLLSAFEKLPRLRVVMRFAGKGAENVPANVRLMSWLPQNDLLGHKKTRAFITHGGNNGQLESLYHGVPQIVMPLFGDQLYNSKRVVQHNFGVTVNIFDFKPDELAASINDVVYTGTYAQTIKRASEISRSFPDPLNITVFWVEHILKYGGDHLRPSYLDMPLYKFAMLDVILFLMLIIHIGGYVIYRLIKICCFGKSSIGKQKSE